MFESLDTYFFSLWTTLKTFRHADEDRGTTRLAFTEADQKSREWIAQVWKGIGLSPFIDGIGNIVGVRGTPPYVLLSSHTDTVPAGGDYDGILGVLAATTIAHHWTDDQGGLMVIDWSSEESSRFGISTLGSRLALGEDPAQYWSITDRDGTTVGEAVHQAYGYPDTPILDLQHYPIKSALELHIEQGTTLEETGHILGIVTAIAAPQRWQVTIDGEANHSAGTAMARRRDALAAASELTLSVESLSAELEPAGLRSTMTQLEVRPGAANVIPGQVQGLIDVRAQSSEALNAYRRKLDQVCENISKERQVTIHLHEISGETPGDLDPSLIEIMRSVFERRNLPLVSLPSWPSHDSLPLSRHLPTAMLFVRNPSGISHNADEQINKRDIQVALEVLYDMVVTVHQQIGGQLDAAT